MGPVDPPASTISVEVVFCPGPGQVDRTELVLACGATLAEALQASGVLGRHGLAPGSVQLGVWCKVREPATVLRDRDRIEVYRPLTVDPKEARRQRYRRSRGPS